MNFILFRFIRDRSDFFRRLRLLCSYQTIQALLQGKWLHLFAVLVYTTIFYHQGLLAIQVFYLEQIFCVAHKKFVTLKVLTVGLLHYMRHQKAFQGSAFVTYFSVHEF